MAQRWAGTCYLKVDGNQFPLGGTWTYSTFTTEKEGMTGLSGNAGYKEIPRIPFFEGEILSHPDFSISDLQNVRDATAVLELANGRVITLFNAWVAGAVDMSAGDGNGTVRIEGLDCREK